jgi:hypothetical protein
MALARMGRELPVVYASEDSAPVVPVAHSE